MSALKDGGPAFPSLEVYEGYNPERERYEVTSDVATGMSLRDYFAAQALSMLGVGLRSVRVDGTVDPGDALGAAGRAYTIADAMLKAREEQS